MIDFTEKLVLQRAFENIIRSYFFLAGDYVII